MHRKRCQQKSDSLSAGWRYDLIDKYSVCCLLDIPKFGCRRSPQVKHADVHVIRGRYLFLVARRFYSFYPQIADVISPSIHPIPSDKSKDYSKISATVSQESAISATVSPKFITPAQILISKLSFSHIREIMLQDDPLARFFYETECIKGTWSVRELRRQISTNLYFRSGVSKDPKKLLESIEPEKNTAALTIRQPFAFEFLGLNAKDVVTESDLEDALITHLQDFLLGLGKGKVYSNDDCACYIERRFASLCVTASGEPLSHSTLRNLTVTSNSDQIHCDIQGADGLLFHIPSQLGLEKG